MKHVRDCGTVRTTVNSSQEIEAGGCGTTRLDGIIRDLIRAFGLPGRALTPRNYGDNKHKGARQPCILTMGVPEHNP